MAFFSKPVAVSRCKTISEFWIDMLSRLRKKMRPGDKMMHITKLLRSKRIFIESCRSRTVKNIIGPEVKEFVHFSFRKIQRNIIADPGFELVQIYNSTGCLNTSVIGIL